MKKLLFLIVVSLMLVGVASARTVWRPDLNTPPIFAPAAGDWMDEGNWDAGVPVMEPEIDNTAGKAVFFHPEATAECWVTTPDAVCWTLNAGDNEPMVAPLVIKDGGTLTTGPVWSGIGYNTVGEVIVEKGGQIDFGSHLWIGMLAGADATLTINGGTVNVGVAFDVGRVVGAEALVSVNAGLLSVTHVTTPAASGWYKHDGGVIDI
ncbi:MAG: hypothetical protein KAJ07_06355, partial [Planctomycetes bacterium]|nr:hypothetical protein [Planctomycetota bacterium]